MKPLIKSLLYLIGIAGALHRLKNRKTLTVIMLHRVLPSSLMKNQGANEEWTLTDTTFKGFLDFLKKHYNIIHFEQLLEAKGQIAKLPNRALLLTFDDGWFDNYEYALPILDSISVPAHIFIATDYINKQKGFWPEQIISACSHNPSLKDRLAKLIHDDLVGKSVHEIIAYLHENEPVKNNFPGIFTLMDPYLPKNRQMLSETEIRKMASMNISFGSHGASHSMMGTLKSEVADEELQRSTETLNKLLDLPAYSLSFPHGHFTQALVKMCHNYDLRHLFTSKACIQVKDAIIHPRIHIAEKAITSHCTFNPAKAAFALFFREQS